MRSYLLQSSATKPSQGNKPTSVRLSFEADARLTRLAERTGRSKAFYLRRIIDDGLDDVEDTVLAIEVLDRVQKGKEKLHSLGEVRKKLGLER